MDEFSRVKLSSTQFENLVEGHSEYNSAGEKVRNAPGISDGLKSLPRFLQSEIDMLRNIGRKIKRDIENNIQVWLDSYDLDAQQRERLMTIQNQYKSL